MAFEELKAAQRAAWGSGSYEGIPLHYEPMLEHLTQRLEPRAGERWLDVAAGTGALAERVATRGPTVMGIDVAQPLVETARRRAVEAALPIAYQVGDAESLPYADASFDVIASNVGVVFTPDHGAVARELARVCRSGGRLGFTGWRPAPSVCGLFSVIARFSSPSPAGMGSTFAWSRPEHVEELLGEDFELRFEEGDAPLRGQSGEALWELFSTRHGPTRSLATSLDAEEREQLRRAYVEFNEEYRTDDGIDRPGPYFLVVGRRR